MNVDNNLHVLNVQIQNSEDNSNKPIELNDFNLPIFINNDFEYESELQKKLEEFLFAIKNRKFVNEKTYKKIEKNTYNILTAIKYYYDADISKAKKLINEILICYKDNKLIVSKLNDSRALRGITKVSLTNDSSSISTGSLSFFKARLGIENFNKKDFLHIPFNKRGIVSTQRFSIAGVPCMYFGATSYVCWLELDKPADREFNISSYEVPLDTIVLNLAITQMLINGLSNREEMHEDVKTMIELFPLIIATSFNVRECPRSFRSEYIISQLIMQCLSELKIDSVAYISKKVENDSANYPYCINLAIPMKKKQDSQNYSEFARRILFTNPINLAEFKNLMDRSNLEKRKKSFANLYNKTQKISYLGKRVKYDSLEFSGLDDYLVNENHQNYENM